MELAKIEKLLEAYFEGSTTVAEEAALRTYFTNADVPPHLAPYKNLFAYYEQQQQLTSTHTVQPPRSSQRYLWMGVAASIVVIVGIFLAAMVGTESTTSRVVITEDPAMGTYQDPEEALRKTKEVLNLVSSYMHQGKQDLVYLHEFEQAKKGLVYLNEFENTKNSLIK